MRRFGEETSECVPSLVVRVDGFLSEQPPNFHKSFICASVQPNSSGDSLVAGCSLRSKVSGYVELPATTWQSSGASERTGQYLILDLKIERITSNNDRIRHNRTLNDK